MKHLFTSEFVSEGHPDKLADIISDAVLDAYLKIDPDAKVACEVLISRNTVIISGEVHTNSELSPDKTGIARQVLREAGYTHELYGCDFSKVKVIDILSEQSPEIRNGVDNGGAGDQGLMFGYACDERPELMPLAISLARKLMERQAYLRKSGEVPWLLPDAKSQVTVLYDNEQAVAIDTILISTQHMPFMLSAHGAMSGSGMIPHGHYSDAYPVTEELIHKTVTDRLIRPVLPGNLWSDDILFIINPSGSFTIGGPAADTGLTGRKIIVDTYGGSCPHGGGAFSGKDPSKVDRSAAYMARYIAKNIVAKGYAKRCTVQLAYSIARPEPLSFMVDFHGTGTLPEEKARQIILDKVNLTPRGIISRLDLKRPIYKGTAAYGHFGRELPEYTWEKTDLFNN